MNDSHEFLTYHESLRQAGDCSSECVAKQLRLGTPPLPPPRATQPVRRTRTQRLTSELLETHEESTQRCGRGGEMREENSKAWERKERLWRRAPLGSYPSTTTC